MSYSSFHKGSSLEMQRNIEAPSDIASKTSYELLHLSLQAKQNIKADSLQFLKKSPTVAVNRLYKKLKRHNQQTEALLPVRMRLWKQSPERNSSFSQQIRDLSFPSLNLTFEQYDLYKHLYQYHCLTNPSSKKLPYPPLSDLYATFLDIKKAHFKKKYKQTRAMRNFNPGNIRIKGDRGQDKDRFAIYSSLEVGRNALLTYVDNWKRGKSKIYKAHFTLEQFFNRYAPGSVGYAKHVANVITKLTGMQVSPTKTPIKDLPTKAFATAIAQKEDGNCYRALKDEGFIS